MALSTFLTDLYISGTLVPAALRLPAGSVTDAAIEAAAGIAATKLEHEIRRTLEVEPATAIAAVSKLSHVAKAAGTIAAVRALVVTKATGADRTVNVDLQKSTGGGAFATVLSATIAFNNGSTNLAVVSATLASAAYVAGDVFKWIVTVAGSAGAQAAGLLAEAIFREESQ